MIGDEFINIVDFISEDKVVSMEVRQISHCAD
jgi:hypothetical protein